MPLKALLIDIDGTLVFQGRAIDGAARALQELAAAGLRLRLLTNISARSPTRIAQELWASGIAVATQQIQTAATACADHVRRQRGASCHLLVPEAMEPLFEGVRRDDRAPDLVVIGDIAERFDYLTLDRVFRLLHAGARLVVPHRNLYWFDASGQARLDAGAFILGLEAAARTSATVTGKPSPVFFEAALDALGVAADEALVVGDDLLTDIAGARAAGLASVLVGTGKGLAAPAAPSASSAPLLPPDHRIPSIAALPQYLRERGLLACTTSS